MKSNIVIICFFLLACSNPTKKNPHGIIDETVFVNVLKDLHLAEANFELFKTNGNEVAQNTLLHQAYQEIYSKYKIDENRFQYTIDYYANHPEQLESIYDKVIKELTELRSNFDRQ